VIYNVTTPLIVMPGGDPTVQFKISFKGNRLYVATTLKY